MVRHENPAITKDRRGYIWQRRTNIWHEITSPARGDKRLEEREGLEARWSGSSAGDYNYEHSPCVGAARRDRDRAPRQWCPGPVDAFGRAALAPAQWPARSYRVSRSVAACASSRCPATALRLTRRRLYAAALHLPASWGQLSSAYLGQRCHHGGAKVSHDW